MKKTAAGLFFVMALLLSCTGSILVNLAAANPVWVGYFPIEPVKTPPTITIQSPIKYQTYASNSVWLNFSIIKPESWFLQINDGYDEQGNPSTLIFVNITSVSYTIDGITNTNIPVHDLTYLSESFPNRSLNFSTNLTLPEGTHNLIVMVEGESYYRPTAEWGQLPLPKIQINATSEAVNFHVTKPELEPELASFPTTLVAAASGVSVVIIGVGLLVYFRRRNHRAESRFGQETLTKTL